MDKKLLLQNIKEKFGATSPEYLEVKDLINFKVKLLRYARKLDNVQEKLQLEVPVKSQKKLFKNSVVNDINYVLQKINSNPAHAKKFKGADIKHYMQKVQDWSDKKNKLCTDRAWMVYIRQFMDSDIRTKKLVKIKTQGHAYDGYVPQI